MKKISLAIFLICSNLSVHAQVKFTPEQYYAIIITTIEKCEQTFPAEKADFKKVRSAFNHLVETNNQLKSVPNGKTLQKTLLKIRQEQDIAFSKYIISEKDRRALCDDAKQGRFGMLSVPVQADDH